jgi:hypothetical protein
MLKRFLKRAVAAVIVVGMVLPIIPKINIANAAENDPYQERFLDLWEDLHNEDNGYFSKEGIPYHSIETLMVEAPDYGHVTTSEALSYYMWLEAMYGKFTGDFSEFEQAWKITETYLIPSEKDQPKSSMRNYDANSPASYAGEYEEPNLYPSKLDFDAPVGRDPIHNELVSAYGTSTIYGMHWLLDVDNWYGFGQRGDGTSKPAYINTFQRGCQESTWETIPQPCWDDLTFGGENGYLDLFTGDKAYSSQFKYTNAPDADSRAVQATYWANQWAKESGVDISADVDRASKMGDYLRYAMFDKYFRKIGSPKTAGNGYDSAHYLMSWYYSWGGGISADWAWKIGCSHNHGGYQNPMAAWVLSTDEDFKPKSSNGASDWGKSLDRQLEFYQWLQSAEGAIAGGASNSTNGRYEDVPSETSTFYGMGYEENPVYHDPGSNTWFGMQAWSMQRVAEYYYKSKDTVAKDLMDNWVDWIKSVVKLNGDGTFEIPNKLEWTGQPDTWNGTATDNSDLHVSVVNYGTDLGIAGSLCNSLLYYSKASGDDEARVLAKEILDRIWKLYRDEKGVAAPELREDYNRFFEQEVYVPDDFEGTMPNGDIIKAGVTFLDIRSKYKDDPDYQKVLDAYNAGKAPELTYHRFWAQCDYAIANGVYANLFGENSDDEPTTTPSPSSSPTAPPATDDSLQLNSDVNSWQGAYSMNITLSNESDESINNWSVKLKKSEFNITNIWGAELTISGDYIIIKPLQWNNVINANGSVSFGLSAQGTPVSNFFYEID